MTAPDVIAALDVLLEHPELGPRSRRTAVRLLRVALEEAVDDVWRRADRASVCSVSRRAQFLVLGQVLVLRQVRDPTAARDAAALWGALSAAAHHHAYELTPTAAEVTGWSAETVDVLARLADHGAPG